MQSACPVLEPEPLPREGPPAPRLIEVAPAQGETEQRSISSRERNRRSSMVPWSLPLLAFVGVAGLVVLFLCQFAQVVALQYDLIAKKETLSELLHHQAQLELSIEQLSALNRVEKEAQKLGMTYPERWQVLDLVHFASQELDGKVASVTPALPGYPAPPVGR